jgi:hypothetical protein
MPRSITLTRPRLVALVAAFFLVPALVGGGAAWATQTFSDVGPSHTFYDEIEWGAKYGVITGYPDGSFKPNNNVTRGASAAFLARYNNTLRVVSVEADPAGAAIHAATATCDADERALAGGGWTSANGLVITDSYPQAPNAWRVRWESKAGGSIDPSLVRAYALCAPAVIPG